MFLICSYLLNAKILSCGAYLQKFKLYFIAFCWRQKPCKWLGQSWYFVEISHKSFKMTTKFFSLILLKALCSYILCSYIIKDMYYTYSQKLTPSSSSATLQCNNVTMSTYIVLLPNVTRHWMNNWTRPIQHKKLLITL